MDNEIKKAGKKAFTLAETLVTLGIISVVAAMTISAVQKASWEMQQKTQYKKVVSTLNGAILKIRADYGSYPSCYYTTLGSSVRSECILFFTELKKQLNIIKTCDNNSYTNGCIPQYNSDVSDSGGCSNFSQNALLNVNPSYVLADGTIIMQYYINVPLVMIDINGQKPPNKWGYDMFDLYFGGNNDYLKVLPFGCFHPEAGGKTSDQMYKDAFK